MFTGAIGFANLVSGQSSWRLRSENAVRMISGESEEPGRSIRVRARFFVHYGNGERQKPKWRIDLHFTFYRTASS